MKKGKYNYDDEIYEDDDYYGNDEYYDDEYGEGEEYEEEEKKPNKNKKNKNNNQNQKNNQNKNQEKNKNNNKNNQKNNLDLSKNINSNSSLSLSKSESSSMSVTSKEIKKEEKEKPKINVKDLNNLKAYPKIEYGKKYTDNQDEKPTISLVIIGHVDSGKSTIVGHLLIFMNEINKNEAHKNLKVKSNKKGEEKKDVINYAFATDEATDERERGVTIDISYKHFSTKTKNVLALDAPGHQDFIPNMIAGTSAADAALLVIDSGTQAFDAGFYKEGQTKEHALLAKTLGINQLIVAINKLELFDWEKKRFDEIVEILEKYLVDELGFDKNKIKFIPLSGLTGDNLNKKISSEKAKWYNGPTLIELIDQLEPPQRAIDAPVRFIINDVSKRENSNNLNLFGKLESGIIIENQEYLIMPLGYKEKIKSIEINKKSVKFMIPGQQGEIHISSNKSSKQDLLAQGNVLSSVNYPVPCIKKFKAHIKTYELKVPISLGQKMMFYLQGQKAQISIKKIERIFNEGSKVSKNNTRFIPKNFYADIIIESENSICAELYVLNTKLSTFTLRIGGETEAMGYITEFLE